MNNFKKIWTDLCHADTHENRQKVPGYSELLECSRSQLKKLVQAIGQELRFQTILEPLEPFGFQLGTHRKHLQGALNSLNVTNQVDLSADMDVAYDLVLAEPRIEDMGVLAQLHFVNEKLSMVRVDLSKQLRSVDFERMLQELFGIDTCSTKCIGTIPFWARDTEGNFVCIHNPLGYASFVYYHACPHFFDTIERLMKDVSIDRISAK